MGLKAVLWGYCVVQVCSHLCGCNPLKPHFNSPVSRKWVMCCRSQPRDKTISEAVYLKDIKNPGYLKLTPVISFNNAYTLCLFLSYELSFMLYTATLSHLVFISCEVGDGRRFFFYFFKKGASFEPGANVVRMESVTQSIACWWLRAVSAVSSPWFMDTKWTLVSKSQLEVHSSNWALLWLWLPCIFFPFMPKYFARQLAPSSFGSAVPQG